MPHDKKKKKKKKSKHIHVPHHLARLLAAEPEDLKDPKRYDEVQTVARSLLRLLLVASD